MTKRMERYKKKVQWSKDHRIAGETTTRTTVRKLLRGVNVRKSVRKRIHFGEVSANQLKTTATGLSSDKEKQVFGRLLVKIVFKKYKLVRQARGFLSSSHALDRGLRQAHSDIFKS